MDADDNITLAFALAQNDRFTSHLQELS